MGLFSDVDWTAFAGGAAGQLVTNINEKNDYYRDLMEKQDDYVNRNGRRIVNDRQARVDQNITLAEELMAGDPDGPNPGLSVESMSDLVAKHGSAGLAALADLKKEFYRDNDLDTPFDINKVYKGDEEFEASADFDIKEALRKEYLIELAAANSGDTASDIEDGGFFSNIFEGSGRRRYEQSKRTATVGGYSPNQIREMESMSLPTSKSGMPAFDRSALADPDAGKLNDAAQNRLALRLTDRIVDSNVMTDSEWRDALGINNPKDITDGQKLNWIINNRPEEASILLRKFNTDGELANNSSLSALLGGPDILSDLLLPPAALSDEDLGVLSDADVDPETVPRFSSDSDAAIANRDDPTIKYAIVNGELVDFTSEDDETEVIIDDVEIDADADEIFDTAVPKEPLFSEPVEELIDTVAEIRDRVGDEVSERLYGKFTKEEKEAVDAEVLRRIEEGASEEDAFKKSVAVAQVKKQMGK
tara:strand:+ start:5277 stop:6704 length:1428 start_codon:yes stop_codon:yes gene_type:complete